MKESKDHRVDFVLCNDKKKKKKGKFIVTTTPRFKSTIFIFSINMEEKGGGGKIATRSERVFSVGYNHHARAAHTCTHSHTARVLFFIGPIKLHFQPRHHHTRFIPIISTP